MKPLTIVVACRYRQSTLNRALTYYSKYLHKINVSVFDSSPKKFNNIKNFKDINYYHSPNAEFGKFISETISKATTPYVVYIGDDDILVVPSALKCVKFLENNKNYIGCAGQFASFKSEINGDQINEVAYDAVEYLRESRLPYIDNKLKRMNYQWKYFTEKDHFIFRKDIAEKSFAIAYSYPLRIASKIFAFIIASIGNTKMIHEFYIMKSQEKMTNPYKGRGLVNHPDTVNSDKTMHNLTEFYELNDQLIKFCGISTGQMTDFYNLFMTNEDKFLKKEYQKIIDNQLTKCYKQYLYGYELVPEIHYREQINQSKKPILKKEYIKYPLFKDDSLMEVNKILQVIEEHPLQIWW